MCDVWCVMCDVWCVKFDVWCDISSSSSSSCDVWRVNLFVWWLTFDVKYVTLDVCAPVTFNVFGFCLLRCFHDQLCPPPTPSPPLFLFFCIFSYHHDFHSLCCFFFPFFPFHLLKSRLPLLPFLFSPPLTPPLSPPVPPLLPLLHLFVFHHHFLTDAAVSTSPPAPSLFLSKYVHVTQIVFIITILYLP